MMLYPQCNNYRQFVDLSGVWDFQFDETDCGFDEQWHKSLPLPRPIAVPASWNDQFEDKRDFLGPAWYQKSFHVPWRWDRKRIYLRFGSVNYLADVWLNGKHIGTHEGGHLPFVFEATPHLKSGPNQMTVRVDGTLAFDRVPPGNVYGEEVDFFSSHFGNFPMAHYDFFPFCGIHRPVLLYAVPEKHIEDITVSTSIEGQDGIVNLTVICPQRDQTAIFVNITGHNTEISHKIPVQSAESTLELTIKDASFWSPGSPALYDLTVQYLHNATVKDEYTLPIGIRTIEVSESEIKLNGEPIKLKGFGRHEDFPVIGRGYSPAVAVKDFALMQWLGANSFRTTHYPYAEQVMQLADRLGFLIIDETPAVGLYFREDGLEKRLELCKQFTREMIARDKNHPSVIMWSVANEPHSGRENAKHFFKALYDQAKGQDPTRPVTVVSFLGEAEESFDFLDVICLNRYRGWYSEPGQIPLGISKLSDELDNLYNKYKKPIIIAEFGADTIPGWHAQPPEMFSEEYQVDFLKSYIELFDTKAFVAGHHIWNLCDFKTSQGITRMGGMNYKGVFTRDRRPKMAAHLLRELWASR